MEYKTWQCSEGRAEQGTTEPAAGLNRIGPDRQRW